MPTPSFYFNHLGYFATNAELVSLSNIRQVDFHHPDKLGDRQIVNNYDAQSSDVQGTS